MDQLDMRFNDAVATLYEAMPGTPAVKIVVDAAVASRNSAVWPKAEVNEAAISFAAATLNAVADVMDLKVREAAEIVVGAATESLPMTDMKRTLA